MHIPLPVQSDTSILVAGAGGGYDVVCALPIALSLRFLGAKVHLAGYSFSELERAATTDTPRPNLFRITHRSAPPPGCYFPEAYLAQWWHDRLSDEISVWSYRQVGVKPLSEHFQFLKKELDLDAVVVVDAGVDGLFEGTEHEIGTPAIDSVSIFAAASVPDVQKFFAFTAFGSEGREHTVRHADALMRISQQVALGGMLGVSSLLPQDSVGKLFLEATRYIDKNSREDVKSIMTSSLVAALKGKFGHHDLTPKTTDSKVWISPLTLLYWFFRLESIAEAKPYRRKALKTETVAQMSELISESRRKGQVLPRLDIPI